MENSNFNSNPKIDVDLRRYLNLCLSYKWRIIFITLLMTLLAVIFVMQIPPSYKAKATLLIESSKNTKLPVSDAYSINSNRREFYSTQFEILKSKEIANIVINNLHLLNNPTFKIEDSEDSIIDDITKQIRSFFSDTVELPPDAEMLSKIRRDKLFTLFQKKLEIKPIRGTQLVDISFTSDDSELAAKIANGIGRAYIDHEVNVRVNNIKKSSTWLSDKLAELSDNLDKAENALQQFREREKIVDVKSAVKKIDEELNRTQNALTIAESDNRKIDTILKLIKDYNENKNIDLSSIPEITTFSSVQSVQNKLLDAQLNLAELSKTYGPKHPKIKTAINEIEVLNQQVDEQIQKLIKGINIEARSARNNVARYKNQLKTIQAKYQQVTAVEHEYLKLTRDVESTRTLYDSFLSSSKAVEIDSDFKFVPARFITEASAPLYPEKQKKRLIVAAAFALTFGLCLGIVFLFEYLNDTVKSSKDIENTLAQRMLGMIPLVKMSGKEVFDAHYYFKEQGRKFAEVIRTLRTNFVLTQINNECKVIEVTSSAPGEGKTTSAINLAISLGQMEKTLLIDGDMRRPSINDIFDIPKYHPGLANMIAGTDKFENCIHRDERLGITVMPAGQIPLNPLELLASKRYVNMLEALKRTYTHIIIDTAPINAVSDSLVIAQNADAVIYVVKSDETRVSVAKNGLNRLIQTNAKIAGVVLNQVDTSVMPESDYYYEYDYREDDKPVELKTS